VYVKRKEKRTKKKYSESECVCLYFFMVVFIYDKIVKKKNEFNILIYMHKYLKDR